MAGSGRFIPGRAHRSRRGAAQGRDEAVPPRADDDGSSLPDRHGHHLRHERLERRRRARIPGVRRHPERGSLCRDSIRGALCLPPSHFLHPDGTPASFRDVNWLAGAFGLDPAATVVVFGRSESDTAFVAGMVFLLGQSRVVIWGGDDRILLGAGGRGAGRLPGMLRSRFYTAAMRDELIALDEDVSLFFGAGDAARLEDPDPAAEAGGASDARDGGGPLLYRRNDGSRWSSPRTPVKPWPISPGSCPGARRLPPGSTWTASAADPLEVSAPRRRGSGGWRRRRSSFSFAALALAAGAVLMIHRKMKGRP